MSILSRFSPRKDHPRGCPACGGPDGTVRFDWRLAREDPDSEFAPYLQTLPEQKPLRLGRLHKCASCGQKWWLTPNRETMVLVPREKLMLLEQWNSQALALSPKLLAKARAIGATPAHHLASIKDYAEVPCRVRTLQGEDLDKCLLTFRSHPPLEPSPFPPRLATEIADIFPSPLALPREVRMATAISEPGLHGRAPTLVLDPEGKPLLLDWVVNFLDRSSYKGSGIRPANPGAKKPKGRVPRFQEQEDLTIFLTDWTPDIL